MIKKKQLINYRTILINDFEMFLKIIIGYLEESPNEQEESPKEHESV